MTNVSISGSPFTLKCHWARRAFHFAKIPCVATQFLLDGLALALILTYCGCQNDNSAQAAGTFEKSLKQATSLDVTLHGYSHDGLPDGQYIVDTVPGDWREGSMLMILKGPWEVKQPLDASPHRWMKVVLFVDEEPKASFRLLGPRAILIDEGRQWLAALRDNKLEQAILKACRDQRMEKTHTDGGHNGDILLFQAVPR
jgi:hypothetical protein